MQRSAKMKNLQWYDCFGLGLIAYFFFAWGYKKCEHDTISKLKDMTKDQEIKNLKRIIEELRK